MGRIRGKQQKFGVFVPCWPFSETPEGTGGFSAGCRPLKPRTALLQADSLLSLCYGV